MRGKLLPSVDAGLIPIVLERDFKLGSRVGMQHHTMGDRFDHETAFGKKFEHVVVLQTARILGFVVLELLLAFNAQLEIGFREVVLGHVLILLQGCGVLLPYAHRGHTCAVIDDITPGSAMCVTPPWHHCHVPITGTNFIQTTRGPRPVEGHQPISSRW